MKNQDECDGGNQVGGVAEENSERISGEPPFKAAFPYKRRVAVCEIQSEELFQR